MGSLYSHRHCVLCRSTCLWVWIGSSLALPEAAFAMIILDATSPFRCPATTAAPVSGLGLLPMAVTQRVTFGRMWRGADAVFVEGIALCSFWLLGVISVPTCTSLSVFSVMRARELSGDQVLTVLEQSFWRLVLTSFSSECRICVLGFVDKAKETILEGSPKSP